MRKSKAQIIAEKVRAEKPNHNDANYISQLERQRGLLLEAIEQDAAGADTADNNDIVQRLYLSLVSIINELDKNSLWWSTIGAKYPEVIDLVRKIEQARKHGFGT